ncbi:MAG TPA: hypothetical protein VFV33_21495 [Gemmatimonadaceae bacterium]|nr:hypothetical protein [Gemmatimonadaceae bacterium]
MVLRVPGVRLIVGACTASLLAIATATPLPAQDTPTGGGTGCVSNGNCQGTVYKDKSNLDRWWYKFCSNCHGVTARPPADLVTTLTSFQKGLTLDKAKFHAMHDYTLTDPVLKVLVPKSKLRDAALIPSPYKELLKR